MSEGLTYQPPFTVLCVDDQQEAVDLIATHLEQENETFDVLTSTTVDEGLEHLRTSDVECVVSDYMMPDRDGIEFLEAVRSRAPNLPFILYTSNGSEDIASNAISAGVTDYLQKGTPNQYSILANRIEHAIVQYRSAQELERKTDLLETAQEIAGLGAWELDVRADEWWFSEEVRELIARSPDNDVPRDQLFEFYNPDDEQRMESAVEEAVANAEPFLIEVPFVNGHGDVTWVRTMGAPQQEGGEVAALRGVIQDITKLTERKRQYETLVENLPGIVYRAQVHPEWPFELLDGECEALTGYSAEELFSLNWGSKIIHPADQQPIYNAVTSTLEDHETFEVTYRIQTKTGEIKWVWERGREIEPGILEGFITDITDRVDYERDLERYQTIVEASGDGMYSLDADGHLTLVNDSFTEIVGYSEEELLGEHIGLVMTPEDVEQGEEIIRSLLGSDSVHGMFEMDLVRADGERIPCENHLVLLPFEETFRGTAGVLRDISERREREQKLERQRDRLEEFASVISHDLRNPLTVAQGYLDMARNQGDEESFELIDTSLDRMERIIQDVLWLSREGRDIGETEAVDLSMAVDEAWRIVTAGSEEPTLITDPADLGTIQADSDRLGQLLENLFRNSVEHVGPDVTVTVTATDSGFAVEDDGEGIPAAIRDRVFERGITSNEDGTGLGLYIAHDIASAHGWSVTLTEGEGGGARFEFEIQPESE